MNKWNPETAQETRINPVTGKEEKKCSKCECIKPIEFFGAAKHTKTGLTSLCKRCHSQGTNKGMRGKYESKNMNRN